MKFFIFIYLVFTSFSAAQTSPNKVNTILPIRNLVVGEIADFNIVSEGKQIDNIQTTIQLNGFSLELKNSFSRNNDKQVTEYVYHYHITAATTGKLILPSIDLKVGNHTIQTKSIEFHSHPLTAFDAHKVSLGGQEISYYSKQFLASQSCVVNQPVASEVRFLFPRNIKIHQWGVAKPNLDSNLVTWRYKRPAHAGRFRHYTLSTSRLDTASGTSYTGASYTANLSGVKQNLATLGEFEASLTVIGYTMGSFGQTPRPILTALKANPITLNILPLPDGAPKMFKGDVGTFKLQADLPDVSSLSSNDSIKVSLTISGSGNLHNLHQPELLDAQDWKVIDISKRDRAEARNDMDGEVTFDILLSPLPTAKMTPKFAFAYFNPETRSYHSLYATQVPVNLKKVEQVMNKEVDPASFLENQKDILGFITPQQQALRSKTLLPFNWQWFPAATAVLIIAIWAVRRRHQYRLANSDQLIKKRHYKELCSPNLAAIDFFKSAGSYIEQWVSTKDDANISKILKERDDSCYLPEEARAKLVISASRKKEILRLLKQMSVIILVCAFSAKSLASGFDDAVQANDYKKAISEAAHTPHLTADQHYNLANCYYKNNQAGLAALHYHKALLLQPEHKEAKQNLRFLETQLKPESIEELPAINAYIQEFPKSTYLFLVKLSLWSIGLTLLVLVLLKPKGYKCFIFIGLCSLSGAVLILSLCATKLYPKSIYFAPIAELSVVTTMSQLKTDPLTLIEGEEAEESVIANVVPSSLCKVLAKRGKWSYIELTTQTRGWMKTDSIKPIAVQQ